MVELTMGETIWMWRKRKGFSQMQLAEKSGVSVSAIKQYETGRQSPTFRALSLIAAGLEMEILLTFEEVSP